jgi:4-amino-4-deoxy-L-arabinose transferase-like glycosyltransferase
MKIFGDTWRSSHMLAALMTGGSIILAVSFVFKRIPESEWRLNAALIAALLMSMNTVVIGFGTIGQPYGMCLFLITAAFQLAAKGVIQGQAALILWSGFCAGLAAASSLLSAPVFPILLLWTAWRSVIGRRLSFCVWWLLGGLISFLPLVCLASLAPYQTFFDIFEYHFFYRAPNSSVTSVVADSFHRLSELLNAGQFMLLLVFSGLGLLFVLGRSQWEAERKSEFYLCAWLVTGLGIFLISIPAPMYQYFVLLMPFLCILASVGIAASASWLRSPGRREWLVPGALLLFVAVLPWWFWQQRIRVTWPQVAEVARVVNQIIPQNEPILAEGTIYFAAKRIPLSGLENDFSQYLQLSPSEAANLHVVLRGDLYNWMAAGRFAAIVTCFATDGWIAGIQKVYSKRITIGRSFISSHSVGDRAMSNSCDIFWSRRAGPG